MKTRNLIWFALKLWLGNLGEKETGAHSGSGAVRKWGSSVVGHLNKSHLQGQSVMLARRLGEMVLRVIQRPCLKWTFCRMFTSDRTVWPSCSRSECQRLSPLCRLFLEIRGLSFSLSLPVIIQNCQYTERFQNTPPLNLPLRHIDYFELESLEKRAEAGRALCLLPSYLKASHNITLEREALPALRREHSYPRRQGASAEMDLYRQTIKITLVFHQFLSYTSQSLSHILLALAQTFCLVISPQMYHLFV